MSKPALKYDTDTSCFGCEPLFEACDHLVYLNNAFRIIGMPVDATTREIKRHISDLKSSLDMDDIESELKHAYAITPPPTLEKIREVEKRLQDPERRLIEELFWFWPEEWGMGRKDPGYAALADNNDTLAFQIWNDALTGSNMELAVRAKHNMAVIYHLVALDSENNVGQVEYTPEQRAQIAEYWNLSLQWWFELIYNDKIFWDLIAERVRMIDDAKLTPEFVKKLKATIPVALIKINAHLALYYADQGNPKMVQEHLAYVRVSKARKGGDNVDKMLSLVLRPMESRINSAVDRMDKTPEEGIRAASEVLKATNSYLTTIEAFVGKKNQSFSYLFDKVADACFTSVIAYGNQKKIWNPCLPVLTTIEQIAVSTEILEKVRHNIEIVKENITYEQANRYCWFCKTRPYDDFAKIEVEMYGDVQRNYPNITWRKISVTVPRCSHCKSVHASNQNSDAACGCLITLVVIGVIVCMFAYTKFWVLWLIAGIAVITVLCVLFTKAQKRKDPNKETAPESAKMNFPLVKEFTNKGYNLGTAPPTN